VRGCYLWDGTTIEADCTVEESIFGFGVTVRERSRVERGCLVADKVVVGPEAYIEPYTRLGKKLTDEEKEALGDDYEEDEDLEESIKGMSLSALRSFLICLMILL
jgi:translation initiation factor eIF-2B subunit epsilon